jgi:hypothetical protein
MRVLYTFVDRFVQELEGHLYNLVLRSGAAGGEAGESDDVAVASLERLLAEDPMVWGSAPQGHDLCGPPGGGGGGGLCAELCATEQ